MRKSYPLSNTKIVSLMGAHPRVSARFAVEKNLWQGRKVVINFIDRGTPHRRTEHRAYYGTLDLTAGRADQIGVIGADGTTTILHVNRAVDIFDLTRTKTTRSAA